MIRMLWDRIIMECSLVLVLGDLVAVVVSRNRKIEIVLNSVI